MHRVAVSLYFLSGSRIKSGEKWENLQVRAEDSINLCGKLANLLISPNPGTNIRNFQLKSNTFQDIFIHNLQIAPLLCL
jgi:hypothetical protein